MTTAALGVLVITTVSRAPPPHPRQDKIGETTTTEANGLQIGDDPTRTEAHALQVGEEDHTTTTEDNILGVVVAVAHHDDATKKRSK